MRYLHFSFSDYTSAFFALSCSLGSFDCMPLIWDFGVSLLNTHFQRVAFVYFLQFNSINSPHHRPPVTPPSPSRTTHQPLSSYSQTSGSSRWARPAVCPYSRRRIEPAVYRSQCAASRAAPRCRVGEHLAHVTRCNELV